MSKYVIDANILFSAMISKKVFYKELFLNREFYAPDFVLIEIDKYKDIILRKTNLTKQLQDFGMYLFSNLNIIPNILISKMSIDKAKELCKNIDVKDAPYIALSLEMDIPMITRDKELYNGLLKKGFNNIILFDTFLNEQI
jgi:predicted nucleic acid-binding protein